jgi:hypothetical protein
VAGRVLPDVSKFRDAFILNYLTVKMEALQALKTSGTTRLMTEALCLLEKLTVLQLVENFPAFCGPRRFIAVFTTARHSFLS